MIAVRGFACIAKLALADRSDGGVPLTNREEQKRRRRGEQYQKKRKGRERSDPGTEHNKRTQDRSTEAYMEL